mmetsp:Transcript_40106/g.95826  ORF Transcript_40106/g.95826 Transcript_40106/m.95826 type:complete len:314 (-) Transcript_40106:105-1046(-)
MEAADVAPRFLPQPGGVSFRGGADHVENHVQLLLAALRVEGHILLVFPVRRQREARGPREERAAVLRGVGLHHLRQLYRDAPGRPHVDGLRVALLQQDELRRAVEARHDVLRHDPGRLVGLRLLVVRLLTHSARHAEIADLHVAVLIHQHIGGLQVPVVDASRVQVLQAHQQMIKYKLDLELLQVHLLGTEGLQVSIPQLHDQVECVGLLLRQNHVMEPHDVGVIQTLEDCDFAQDPLAVDLVAEHRVDPLDGHHPAALLIQGLADCAVGACTDPPSQLIPVRGAPRVGLDDTWRRALARRREVRPAFLPPRG